MEKFEYTAEMALFEIWGAIQMATASFDGFDTMNKLKSMAQNAIERAGLLEGENDG